MAVVVKIIHHVTPTLVAKTAIQGTLNKFGIGAGCPDWCSMRWSYLQQKEAVISELHWETHRCVYSKVCVHIL